jgi:Asp-tRNA(Asn)/Glu-tRNA(Gln) amidotransferase A subunit family amidase
MAYEVAQAYVFECARYPQHLSGPFQALCEQGRGVKRDRYLAAREQIARAQSDFVPAFDGYDAWLAPSAPGEAPPASQGTGDPALSRLWTALQAPAVALPAGLGPRGLPLGIQLLAPKGSDDALLDVAAWSGQALA